MRKLFDRPGSCSPPCTTAHHRSHRPGPDPGDRHRPPRAPRSTDSSPRSARKDLQALGAVWGDKNGAIRDNKRISRDELEKRELRPDVLLQPRQLQGRRATSPSRWTSACMTVALTKGTLTRTTDFFLVSGPERWYVRSARHGPRARSLHQEAVQPEATVAPSQLGELDEHARRGAGVEERDTFPFGADAGCLVDEANSGGAAASEGTVEVVDGEADVMDAGATFGDELADRRVGTLPPRAARRASLRPRGRRSGHHRRRRAGLREGRADRGRREGSRRARARRCRRGRCAGHGGIRRSCECAGQRRRRR